VQGDDGKKQPVRCDRPEPLALTGVATELVDVIDGQPRASAVRILVRCGVDNAVSDLLVW